jgi:hypothetical protein
MCASAFETALLTGEKLDRANQKYTVRLALLATQLPVATAATQRERGVIDGSHLPDFGAEKCIELQLAP